MGQPFKAEINLVAVKKEEKFSLTARLASQDTFRQANVDYLPLLSTFKTTIETRSDGQPYVRIISPQPVAEPLLNMLVELNWSSGRLLREYTVLIPSPENDAHSHANASAQAATSAPAKAEPATGVSDSPIKQDGNPPVRDKAATGAKAASGAASVSRTHSVYGPVKSGDTLAEIARNIILPAGVSFNQLLVALHRANRNAFIGNNMHQLKTGPILRIPDNSEINTINPTEANQEVKMQTADWNRRRFAGIEDAAEELKQTATGKIAPPAEVAPASAQEPPREVLKLSKSEEARNAAKNAGGNLDGSADGKVGGKEVNARDMRHAMEEDAIAKNGSLRETNERIALLEKNIEELQRLLELRNLALAEMQKQAEIIQPIQPMKPAKPDDANLTSSPSSTQPVSVNTETNGSEELTIATATDEPVEIAKAVRAASLPAHQALHDSNRTPRTHIKNMVDDLTANIEYLGGALVLLITGIVGVSMACRPKEAGLDNENMASSILDPALHDKAVAAVMSQGTHAAAQADGVDPAAEGGPYPDGRDTQTGKIIRDTSAGDCVPLERPGTPVNSPERVLSASVPAPLEERDLAEINLNMEDTQFADSSANPVKSGFAERSPHWHEIVSRIDLARAYQEMGDKDAAMQVLQEVMLEGDAKQQESARLILANLQGAVSE